MAQNIYINAPPKRGCLSQIIRGFFILLAVLFGLPILVGLLLQQRKETQPPVVQQPAMQPPETSIFSYIETIEEPRTDGLKNVMEIYCYDGPIDVQKLSELCRQQKTKMSREQIIFYRLFLFDKRENVVKSSTPIGAAFDLDEKAVFHIRANYTFNKLNGYSKLSWHEKNTYEHIPSEVDL